MARQNPDEDRLAWAAETAGPPSNRVSRVAERAQSKSPPRSNDEIRESVQHWKRVFRSLERQQETDPVRRWLRARSLDIAIRAVALSDAGDAAGDLTALGEQVADLLEDLEPTIDAAVRREIETWIDLRHERDALDRRLTEAWSGLHRTFEERSRRRVREWFAQDLPVHVLAGEPVPAVTSEADAIAILPKAEEAAALARAVCPPKPPKATQEIVSEWAWDPSVIQQRPLDLAEADRAADEAHRSLAVLPRAGPQPMWMFASDIPFAYKWLHRAWSVSLFAAPIATVIVVTELVMKGPNTEDVGFWRQMQAAATFAWAFVGAGWLAKGLVDSFLTKKHAAWVGRSAPIDNAHRAIGWQYVVRRAVVEQREAEADALRDFIAASGRLRGFDEDPDLGRRLVAVRDRRADLADHVDAATADLKWASGKAWPDR